MTTLTGPSSEGGGALGVGAFIEEAAIAERLAAAQLPDRGRVRAILAHAREMQGLDPDDVAHLMAVDDAGLLDEIFTAARCVKEAIYGNRLVLFAPLYITNHCANECAYCAFRARNTALARRRLTTDEIAAETRALLDAGHKRVLLVAGESYPREGFDYVLQAIETIYATRTPSGEIRRINVNVAPLSVAEFERLKAAGIGTYQIFQETYHRETYARVHTGGVKRDYDWRVSAPDRAMKAGLDDVGIGVLYGLYDWKFDTLAMLEHVRHLERRFGVGPHTISVPRLEPALGSELASNPEHAVSDRDFLKLVSILRLAVPYTGLIMSTRESADMRRASYALGVSQISAGSCTSPGGYAGAGDTGEQFEIGDHRPLDEVVAEVAGLGYTPSFCTACYRLGRTGQDFMDLAKPGLIKDHCGPNALSSFLEYLRDSATPGTQDCGEKAIHEQLEQLDATARATSSCLLERVRSGERDVFV